MDIIGCLPLNSPRVSKEVAFRLVQEWYGRTVVGKYKNIKYGQVNTLHHLILSLSPQSSPLIRLNGTMQLFIYYYHLFV